MRTAEDFLQKLRQGLIPVPSIQPGVCRVCHGACLGFDTCYSCSNFPSEFSVVPISFSVQDGFFHHHLRHYKGSPRPEIRDEFTHRLAALLVIFLRNHQNKCLGGTVDLVATVPSTNRDSAWQIVRRLHQFADQENPISRTPGKGLAVANWARGKRVLLVDDTFTSGSSLYSAFEALMRVDAKVVGPVVLGRHIRPDQPRRQELLQRMKAMEWDDSKCCRCASSNFDPPLTGQPLPFAS